MKKIRLLIFVFLAFLFIAKAQKLPKIQQKSIWAPKSVKIDGQADEWGDLQAYNKTTRLFYTLANDNKNVYLALKATDQDIIQKLTIGGVTLSIAESKGDLKKHAFAVSYKFVAKKGEIHYLNLNDRLEIARNITRRADKADSLKKVLNNKLGEIVKTVEIYGAKDLQHSMTSAQKDNDIKVALRFDEKLNCIYELAIPLKTLTSTINKSDRFIYQIELNGAAGNHNTTIEPSASGKFLIIKTGNTTPFGWPNTPKYAEMLYPTSFIGKYLLAEK